MKHEFMKWERRLERSEGRRDMVLTSGFASNPKYNTMRLDLYHNGPLCPTSTYFNTTDVEWLANQCLEWLRLNAKADTEWKQSHE